MARMLRISEKEETVTLLEAAQRFIAVKQAQQINYQTMLDYKYKLREFINASHNTTDYDTLNEDTLAFFAAIPDTSPARYNKPFSCISCFFSWMVEEKIIPKSPIKANKLKKKKDDSNIKPATIDALKKFMSVIDKRSYTGLRDLCIIHLMLDTGIRTKECLNLHNTDFNPNCKSIIVSKLVAKARTQRTVYLNSNTCAMINHFIKQKPAEWHDWLFPNYEGNRLTTTYLDRGFRNCSEASGVKITPYQLRHSFATLYLQNGGDLFTLQKQMGHSDLRMTKRYAEISETQVEESHKAYSPANLLQTTRTR